jgi:Na+/glutamate symporter
MNRQQFGDMQRLAQQRTRDAVGLVLQLIDDQEDRTAILLACTLDFVHGTATSIMEQAKDEDQKISEDTALAAATVLVIRALGMDVMEAALKTMKAGRIKQ